MLWHERPCASLGIFSGFVHYTVMIGLMHDLTSNNTIPSSTKMHGLMHDFNSQGWCCAEGDFETRAPPRLQSSYGLEADLAAISAWSCGGNPEQRPVPGSSVIAKGNLASHQLYKFRIMWNYCHVIAVMDMLQQNLGPWTASCMHASLTFDLVACFFWGFINNDAVPIDALHTGSALYLTMLRVHVLYILYMIILCNLMLLFDLSWNDESVNGQGRRWIDGFSIPNIN